MTLSPPVQHITPTHLSLCSRHSNSFSYYPSISNSLSPFYLSPSFLTQISFCQPLLTYPLHMTESFQYTFFSHTLLIAIPLSYPIISYLITSPHYTYGPQTHNFQHIQHIPYNLIYNLCLASFQHCRDYFTFKYAYLHPPRQ